ncbi:DUF6962 family protein [Candidatus Lokiarchaeum ossiferum]|uniref:DUF6962 family protein n=1 Tax=Candidatus Lokiarchaeum ossiferum TaxID=2951803 RepID=UPI00352E977E
MQSELVPIQPITSVTDILLTLEAVFLIYLIVSKAKKANIFDASLKLWVGGYGCIVMFAILGAISHFLSDGFLVAIFWPPTMIFGGLSFVCVVSALIFHVKPDNNKLLLLLPIFMVIIYVIIAIIYEWKFIIWVGLLGICSILIYFMGFLLYKKDHPISKNILLGNTIILLSGIFQFVGGMFFYPEDQEGIFLNPEGTAIFRPQNDGFHIIAGIGLYVFYLGIRNAFFREKTS